MRRKQQGKGTETSKARNQQAELTSEGMSQQKDLHCPLYPTKEMSSSQQSHPFL